MTAALLSVSADVNGVQDMKLDLIEMLSCLSLWFCYFLFYFEVLPLCVLSHFSPLLSLSACLFCSPEPVIIIIMSRFD